MGFFSKGSILGNIVSDVFGSSYGGGYSSGRIIGNISTPSIVASPPSYSDVPESFKEKMRNSDSLFLQTVQAFDDAKEEFKEVMTDGFVEMCIKGNYDYKTSFEKREEADELIRKEQEKYSNISEKVNAQIKELNTHIENNNIKKRRILSSLSMKVPACDKVGYVSNEAPSAPSMQTDDCFDIFFKPVYGRIPHANMLNLLLGKPPALSRIEHADDYLEDAKDYKVQISGEIAKLYSASAKIATLETILQEEEFLLNGIETSLKLNRYMDYKAVSDYLNVLVATYIIDQTGAPNSIYNKTIEYLKKICPAL